MSCEEITVYVINMGSDVTPFPNIVMTNKISGAKCQHTLSYLNSHAAVCEPLDANEIENVRRCYFR